MRLATAVLFVSLSLGAATLSADGSQQPTYGSKYDAKTGNKYNWETDSSGETTVRGRNTRTGSTWKTQIENDGDMRGKDADGNSWTYNATTGRYYNKGTGETRYDRDRR